MCLFKLPDGNLVIYRAFDRRQGHREGREMEESSVSLGKRMGDEKARDGGERCADLSSSPWRSPIRLSSAANGNDVDARGGRLNQRQNAPGSPPRGEKKGGGGETERNEGHAAGVENETTRHLVSP